jgi:hypothetical protein
MRKQKRLPNLHLRRRSCYCLTAPCVGAQYLCTLQSVLHVHRAACYGFWSAPTCRFRNAPRLKVPIRFGVHSPLMQLVYRTEKYRPVPQRLFKDLRLGMRTNSFRPTSSSVDYINKRRINKRSLPRHDCISAEYKKSVDRIPVYAILRSTFGPATRIRQSCHCRIERLLPVI